MLKLLITYYTDAGLLVLRLGMGVLFLFHGGPKIVGGPERWKQLGMAMANFGIDFMPAFWGFMAACSEFFGAICLILGLLFRPACAFMAITMVVAITMHLSAGDGFTVFSHPMKAGLVFLSLFIAGPGRYAIDQKIVGYLNRKQD